MLRLQKVTIILLMALSLILLLCHLPNCLEGQLAHASHQKYLVLLPKALLQSQLLLTPFLLELNIQWRNQSLMDIERQWHHQNAKNSLLE